MMPSGRGILQAQRGRDSSALGSALGTMTGMDLRPVGDAIGVAGVRGYRGPLGLMNPVCRIPSPADWAEESRTVGAEECDTLVLENAGRWCWRMRAVGIGECGPLVLENADAR